MTPFQLRDKAIRALYPNTVVVSGDKAFDNSGVEITIDESFISEEISRLETEQAATQYQRDRKAEYDQLNQYEMMFDDEVNGTTTWIDAINAIKAKYPKPE